MCFSASASFITSAVLFAGGVAAVKFSTNKRQLPFAIIPYIFSFQQFSEGILWLSLSIPEFTGYKITSMFAFLIIAQGFGLPGFHFQFILMKKIKGEKKYYLRC